MNSLGDARFHERSPPQSVSAIAAAAHGTSVASDRMFTGVAPLQVARPDEVSFINDRRHLAALAATEAGAVVVHPALSAHVPATAIAILAEASYEGWARIARLFHPIAPTRPGIHALAHVDAEATVDPTAEIGAFVTVEAGAEIGPRTRLSPYAHIGAGVVIGADCRIGSHCTISHALIGDRVTLSPGVRIGQEGFGFAQTPTGFFTIPQLGRVLIEDDVEIGANCAIDRGSLGDTVIGAGSRLDNLVHVAHNVKIGKCCVLAGQVGIAGSAVFEDFVQVGGQAAFATHVRVGRRAQVGGKAGVIGDVAPGTIVMGFPAQPRHDFFRQVVTLKQLARRRPNDAAD